MEDMVAEIRTLTGDVEKIRRLMAECREIGQRYSWENVSPRYIQVYERIFETIT
jgi:glycosyltransferase involved in cell wall biosynthesis